MQVEGTASVLPLTVFSPGADGQQGASWGKASPTVREGLGWA